MKPKPKVVFDTNIFISAIIFGGNPRQCLELAREGGIRLVVTKLILLELSSKLRDKFFWSEREIKYVLEGLAVFAEVIDHKQRVNIIKEEKMDNEILACAKEARANFIVSGDKKHLLSLHSFEGIPIISAKEFLDIYYNKT